MKRVWTAQRMIATFLIVCFIFFVCIDYTSNRNSFSVNNGYICIEGCNSRSSTRIGSSGSVSLFARAEAEVSCQQDAELETLVRTNGTRVKLYMLCHDDESEKVAREFAHCKEHWISVVRLNISQYFETVIYRDVFPQRMAEWNSGNVDYVITATYKTVHRLKLHEGIYYVQDLAEIKRMLLVARDGDYDFVPYLRSFTGLLDSIIYWHGPHFKTAWDALLHKLGYSTQVIRSFDTAKPFYRNIFMSKPRTLLQLCELMQRAMAVVAEDVSLRQLFEVDAKYAGGRQEVAVKVFGVPYYYLHPFIFERLPSFLLQAMHAKVCIDKTGPCAYNY